ncbi:MAG TPA: hypothetical protein VI603_02720 [Saprospiraceae bacterium]|nr:hypothetical protein [Saprospiraceae bacterium]
MRPVTSFVANIGSRLITRIDVRGSQSCIYQGTAPWYPVAYYNLDGIGYVMETGITRDNNGNMGPRILKIQDGSSTILINTEDVEISLIKRKTENFSPLGNQIKKSITMSDGLPS